MNERQFLEWILGVIDDAEIKAGETRGCSVQGAIYLKALHEVARMSADRAGRLDTDEPMPEADAFDEPPPGRWKELARKIRRLAS